MFSYIAQGDEDSVGELLEKITAKRADKLDEFSATFDRAENQRIDALEAAFKEYLSLKPTSSDPNEVRKQQAEALETLMAKYSAATNGGNWQDIL